MFGNLYLMEREMWERWQGQPQPAGWDPGDLGIWRLATALRRIAGTLVALYTAIARAREDTACPQNTPNLRIYWRSSAIRSSRTANERLSERCCPEGTS
ncbi:hypothetical protein [Thermobaculum terrenum]|uniref:hypothetical protein n=1 Tax=Thermobaculum terrenum TaxID=166501 RepID=UPI00019C0756|nr:hypothetical protein [Thermobaculum terrenum]